MSETVSKRLAVTFDDGLPLGTRGAFTYQGERWIALPLTKYQSILHAADRMTGRLARVRGALTRRIGSHPGDAGWILPILAGSDPEALIREKIEAQTS